MKFFNWLKIFSSGLILLWIILIFLSGNVESRRNECKVLLFSLFFCHPILNTIINHIHWATFDHPSVRNFCCPPPPKKNYFFRHLVTSLFSLIMIKSNLFLRFAFKGPPHFDKRQLLVKIILPWAFIEHSPGWDSRGYFWGLGE